MLSYYESFLTLLLKDSYKYNMMTFFFFFAFINSIVIIGKWEFEPYTSLLDKLDVLIDLQDS